MNRRIDGWLDERTCSSIRYPYSYHGRHLRNYKGEGVSRVLTSRKKLQFGKLSRDRMSGVNKAPARLNVNILHDMLD